MLARSGEASAQLAWNLAGKVHVETLFADAPRNESAGVGQANGQKAIDGKSGRLRTDQISGATIRKHEERQQLFEILRFLHMKRAQLQAHDEHFGFGLGAYDVARGFERVDGGIAAHEADEGAFDGWIEAEVLDDVVVEPRCVKTGAGSDDDVGDGAAFFFCKRELVEGAFGQPRSELLEGLHAAGSCGEVATNEK